MQWLLVERLYADLEDYLSREFFVIGRQDSVRHWSSTFVSLKDDVTVIKLAGWDSL